MDDYIAGKDKFFDKITVPEKDLAELNIILALDASGSTAGNRQYYMSGVTYAVKRALEELGVMHTLMVYDDQVALVDVDKKGLSTNGNTLMSNYQGSGGNNEGMVIDIAHEIVKNNSDYTNIVIVVSDGGVADVRNRLAKLRKATKGELGVYIFGYGSSFDEGYASKIFGKEYSIANKDAKEFSDNIIKVLSKELEKATIKGEQ